MFHFFQNLALIIIFVSSSIYLFNKPLHQLKFLQKFLIGLLHSIFGIIFIYFGIIVEGSSILDFRQLAIISSAYFGGLTASIVTGLFLGIYRLFFVNGLNYASIMGAFSIFVLSLGLGIISNTVYRLIPKWTLMICYGLIIGNSTFLLVLSTHLSLLLYYSLVILFGCVLTAIALYLANVIELKIAVNQTIISLLNKFNDHKFEQIYLKVLEGLIYLIQCEYGNIAIFDGKKFKILCIFENHKYKFSNYVIEKGEVEVLEKMNSAAPIMYPNWKQNKPSGELERKFYAKGVRSSIHIPVIYKSECIAVINLGSNIPFHFTKMIMNAVNQILPVLSFGLSLIYSESKFATISQSANDGIILTNSHGQIISWNKGAENIFGYSKVEAIGKDLGMIIPYHNKEAPQGEAEGFFKKGMIGKTLEIRGIRKDGEIVPLEVSINKWHMGGILYFSCIIRNISERKKAEQELRDSEERYKKLIKLSPDGLCVYQGSRIILANEKAASLIGLNNPSELIGLKSLAFIPAEDHGKVQSLIKELYYGEETHKNFEVPLKRMNGDMINSEVSMSIIQYNGKPAIMATFRDITERKRIEYELKEANEKLERLSNIDGLTGIPNRRYFDDRLKREWEIASTLSSPLSILLCDIDYFKAFNDTYGHLQGDECLTQIAKELSKNLIQPNHFAARYGGEEFVVLLPDTNLKSALKIAARLKECVANLHIPHISSKVHEFVSTSIGVATFVPSSLASPNDLIEQADKALYEAKHLGRNRVAVYPKSIL
ncbi:diguanylate cyclase [Bacillus sp. BRMEA1]|uniref:diguanylate cyclase domain-containing protein n=1 Tax=Neobacillus endophyticus TaxID=2738405 RepID=UPI001566F6DF|nr:diguanylate cyclase [Neobacillus endophyticus]NRD77582.1 diguanylate cyclase [Neobacillus endophyticus]